MTRIVGAAAGGLVPIERQTLANRIARLTIDSTHDGRAIFGSVYRYGFTIAQSLPIRSLNTNFSDSQPNGCGASCDPHSRAVVMNASPTRSQFHTAICRGRSFLAAFAIAGVALFQTGCCGMGGCYSSCGMDCGPVCEPMCSPCMPSCQPCMPACSPCQVPCGGGPPCGSWGGPAMFGGGQPMLRTASPILPQVGPCSRYGCF